MEFNSVFKGLNSFYSCIVSYTVIVKITVYRMCVYIYVKWSQFTCTHLKPRDENVSLQCQHFIFIRCFDTNAAQGAEY